MNLSEHLGREIQEKFLSKSLHESEATAIKDFQRRFLSTTLLYGGSVALSSWFVGRRLFASTRYRALFVSSTTMLATYVGMQSVSREFLVEFYALPDSPIAQQGREYMREHAPNSSLLKEINRKLAKSNRPIIDEDISWSTTQGTSSNNSTSLDYYFDPPSTSSLGEQPPPPPFAHRPKTLSKTKSNAKEQHHQPAAFEQDDLDLVKPQEGDTRKLQRKTQAPDLLQSGYPHRTLNEDPKHDVFSEEWDRDTRSVARKPTRTWEQVREEYQRKQQNL